MVNTFPTCFLPWNPWRTVGTIRTWQPHRIRNVFYQRTWISSTCIRHQHEGAKRRAKDTNRKLPRTSWTVSINPQPSSSTNGSVILEKLKLRRISVNSMKVPLVVLLVTPSWIGLVNDASTFIPSLLLRMFRFPERGPGIDVLVAVIDKISLPLSVSPKNKFVKYGGSEGISVSTFDSKTVTPDLWSPRDRPTDRQTMTIQQRCTLSFQFKPTRRTAWNTLQKESDPLKKYLLELPVANTLFHNGQTSSLFAEHWAFSTDSKSSPRSFRTKKVSLPQQTLRVTRFCEKNDVRTLYTRLKIITPSRIVAAAMGNIIRTFYSGLDSIPNETVPASRELERAVSQHIETRRNSADKVEIWALVTPGENERSQPGVRRVCSGDILNDVENGSRLHKVLSGGGGWGAKEGLLALDPDSDFNNHGNELQLDFEDDQNTTLGKFQGFGDVVKPGDQVEFILLEPPAKMQVPERPSSHFSASPSVCLGTLPSFVDMVPNQSDLPADFIFFQSHFGMLTEHGMTLKVETHPSNDSRHSVAAQVGSVMQTKLDAPGTCFHATIGVKKWRLDTAPTDGEVGDKGTSNTVFPISKFPFVRKKKAMELHRQH